MYSSSYFININICISEINGNLLSEGGRFVLTNRRQLFSGRVTFEWQQQMIFCDRRRNLGLTVGKLVGLARH